MTAPRESQAGAVVRELPRALRINLRTPARLPARVESEPFHIHEARCKAVIAMGTKWVRHPEYVFNPRHSSDQEVYGPARQAYLAEVARLAAADRARNPAYLRACAVRRVLEQHA